MWILRPGQYNFPIQVGLIFVSPVLPHRVLASVWHMYLYFYIHPIPLAWVPSFPESLNSNVSSPFFSPWLAKSHSLCVLSSIIQWFNSNSYIKSYLIICPSPPGNCKKSRTKTGSYSSLQPQSLIVLDKWKLELNDILVLDPFLSVSLG